MPTKIFPMPKIEFKKTVYFYGACLDYEFFRIKLRIYIKTDGNHHLEYYNDVNSQTIVEHGDVEVLKTHVLNYCIELTKRYLEPVVLPDSDTWEDAPTESMKAEIFGWNNYREQLLELNPNCIRISE